MNISPFKAAIQADVAILQLLGPAKRGDMYVGLAGRLERFMRNISADPDAEAAFERYAPLLHMICRSYNTGWLILARWHMETRSGTGYRKAKEELTHFLENDSTSMDAAEAWRMLGNANFQLGDVLGEIHAFVERAQISTVSFNDVSNTANRLNGLLRENKFPREQKEALAHRIMGVMERRRGEASADDFSRMAWLAITLGDKEQADDYVKAGLALDSANAHCRNLESKRTAGRTQADQSY